MNTVLVSILSVVSTTVTACEDSKLREGVTEARDDGCKVMEVFLISGRVVDAMFETTFSELLTVEESPLKKVVKKVKVVYIVLTSTSSAPMDGAIEAVTSGTRVVTDGVTDEDNVGAGGSPSVARRLFVTSNVV